METRGMRKQTTLGRGALGWAVSTALAMAMVFVWGLLFGGAAEAATGTGFQGWFVHNMAPIMFGSLIIVLLMGYPAAFSLAANGLIFGFIGIEFGLFQPNFFNALPNRVYAVMTNETLLAVPFFTFMGMILERSGMAEDLLDTLGQVFGSVRGGLAYAVIFVGALLAATTGGVAASVISMGLISLPIMLRYGYDRRVASGVIAASGTLAQIIPPSLVLIVMADQLGRSVGDMYAGAFLPGMGLVGFYAIFIFFISMTRPQLLPGLPPEAIGFREPNGSRGLASLGILYAAAAVVGWMATSGHDLSVADHVILGLLAAMVFASVAAIANWIFEKATGKRFLSAMAQRVTFVMAPPLFLIFLVLGTIFIGVATPTEGGAMGAVGALLLAGAKRLLDKDRRRLNYEIVKQALYATAKLSAFVMFILIGARVFSLTFYGVNGHHWVEELLTSIPGGVVGFLIVVNLLIFFLAFFLDYFELAFIIVPLLVPAANALGIDLIWLGVMLSVNMQTSFLHPPFGFALFFLRSVAPKKEYTDRVTGKRMAPVTTPQILWGATPYVLIQLVMVAIVAFFPEIVMHYKSGHVELDATALQDTLDGLAPNLDGDMPGLDLDMTPNLDL